MCKFKRIIAAAASICMISAMSVSVSADTEEAVNAPDPIVTDIAAIVSDIVDGTADETVTEITTVDNSTETYTDTFTDTAETTTPVESTVSDTTSDSLTTTAEITVTTSEAVKNSRDVIISLDVSGSMDGEPFIKMQEAAVEFCVTMLKADPDAKIAIVSFETDSEIGVQYTNDIDELTNYINNLVTGDMTNFSDAFEDIKFLLETGNGVEKNVILMADGLPNEGAYSANGKYGPYYDYENYALEYDIKNLQPLATVYTIGFFHNISDEDKKQFAQDFMKDLASEPVDYYDADLTNLKGVFNDIAYQIVPEAKPQTTDIAVTVTEAAAANDVAESPKTSDTGVLPVIMVAALAGTVIIATRKRA